MFGALYLCQKSSVVQPAVPSNASRLSRPFIRTGLHTHLSPAKGLFFCQEKVQYCALLLQVFRSYGPGTSSNTCIVHRHAQKQHGTGNFSIASRTTRLCHETYQLIRRPQSHNLDVPIVIADCVPLPQGVKRCHKARVPVLVHRPPQGYAGPYRSLSCDSHLKCTQPRPRGISSNQFNLLALC